MLSIQGNKMSITKGDTATIVVALYKSDGSAYTMQTGDTLTYTARKTPDSDVLFTASSKTNTLSLPATSTKKLIAGKCCFDIQLTLSDGAIYTIVGPTDTCRLNLTVYEEVTA